MSPASAPNRRSFLARGAAVAAVPAVAALAGGALAKPASAGTLPDYAPVPPSALGPAVTGTRSGVRRRSPGDHRDPVISAYLPGGEPEHAVGS